jgi:AP-3 complex subunit mu
MDAIVFLGSSGELITSRRYAVCENETHESGSIVLPARLMNAIAFKSQYLSAPPIFVDEDSCTTYVSMMCDGVCIIGRLSESVELGELQSLCLINCLVSLLRKYYGKPITEDIIKTNFNTLYSLLDEFLEGCLPLCTELNILESTAIPPASSGIVDKLATVMSPNATASLTNSLTGVSPDIWWRRAGVFHGSNEFYVEVVDRINCTILPSGKVLASSVSGSIRANCKLSGVPDLMLSFKDAQIFGNETSAISFHPSVRLPRWIRDKKLSFTPPDGEFVVAEYTITDKEKGVLPFTLTCSVSFESTKGSLSVSVSPKLSILDPTLVPKNPNRSLGLPQHNSKQQSRIVEDLVIKIKVPRSVGSATLITQSGSAIYDPPSSLVVWTPSILKPESGAVRMEGTLLYDGSSNAWESAKEFRCSATVDFTVRGWNASGVRVETVDVSGVDYTPFKGCRYTTCGGSINLRL